MIRNASPDRSQKPRVADRFLKDAAAAAFEHAMHFTGSEVEIQVMQDRDAENDVDPMAFDGQIVCGTDDEVRGAVQIIEGKTTPRQVDEIPRDVDGNDFGAAAGEQQRVLARAAAEVEDGPAAHVAEKRVRVLERINGIERRRSAHQCCSRRPCHRSLRCGTDSSPPVCSCRLAD